MKYNTGLTFIIVLFCFLWYITVNSDHSGNSNPFWILIPGSTTGKYNPEDFLEYVQVPVVARLLGNNISPDFSSTANVSANGSTIDIFCLFPRIQQFKC